ncbi:MAG: radical SAM protein [Myxococcales bacterium]|nr:radical SAM protein [Myxococcales bacterium]
MANLGYMQLVRHCNQYCRFCSNPETPYMLDLETATRQLDDFRARGYFGVILTGGEPSLSPIVVEVTRAALARDLHPRMITNGTKVAELETARAFVAAGLRHYHVSIHSHRAELEDFLTGVRGSFARAEEALDNLAAVDREDRAAGGVGVTVNINTVINAFNADHLDANVRYFAERHPIVRHFVWNNLDPSMGRAETNRDTAHRLRDFELSLGRAMRLLTERGLSFRAERVPLCFMTEHAHASTETRKIVKGEERIVHFLDDKGTVRQTDFRHAKAEVCRQCSLDSICGGLFELGAWYDLAELSPVFVSKERIVRRIRSEPDPAG